MKVDDISLMDFKKKTSEVCNMKYDDFIKNYIDANKDVNGFVLQK
jgi:hypothetical protein